MGAGTPVKIGLCVGIAIHLINMVTIYHYGFVHKLLRNTSVVKTRDIISVQEEELWNVSRNFAAWRNYLFPMKNYTDYNRFFINVSKSHEISVERDIPDVRPYECRKMDVTSADLPDVSVIIPMHNEPWSTLLRTVHSVLNRSPPELLGEIIIIDDMSDLPFLQGPLDEYLKMLSKTYCDVYVFRSKTRLGTMKSRNIGATLAKGEVLVYLDSHTEVGVGWLEPLVWEIYKNRQTVSQPAIDTIDSATFRYSKYMENMRGEFKWTLGFSFEPIPERYMLGRTSTDPILTPAIIGCCFAIDRKYYLDLGGLDEGMKTWGAEDVELSLRVWMCGGNMKVLECSRVGHIFKSGHPFKMPYGDLLYNEQRIAELWLGDHKKIFYSVHGAQLDPNSDIGDLTAIRNVKQNLNCKSFSWFLEMVYPELHVPPVSTVLFGKLTNSASSLCLGLLGAGDRKYFGFVQCWGTGPVSLALTKHGSLKLLDACLGVRERYIILVPCAINDSSQQWSYNTDHQIEWHDGNSCIMHVSDPDPTTGHRQTVMLMSCIQKTELLKYSQWTFSYMLFE